MLLLTRLLGSTVAFSAGSHQNHLVYVGFSSQQFHDPIPVKPEKKNKLPECSEVIREDHQ